MLKKCLALLVLFAVVIGCIPLGANAQSESARVIEEIRSIYSRIQRATGHRDLSGLCGTMTAYQLYYLGINTRPIILDGKNQYDAYKDLEVTTGGHPVQVYSAQEYSLQEALYTLSNGGTKDVYNILVGFEWTRSQAGRRFGHSVVINAILDGIVYFCEGFNTSFDTYVGSPSICTIDEFAKSYNSFALFEGLVVFGRKSQADFSQEYSCNAFLQVTNETQARNEPSAQQSAVLRTVKRGERLEAAGLYKNESNELYYRIVDSGNTAYVNAEDVTVLSMRYDDVQVVDATYPEVLQPGENFTINGVLRSTHNKVHNVMARIIDELDRELACFPVPVDGRYKKLEGTALRHEINFSHLLPGNYTLEISAEVENHYAKNGGVITETQRCFLEEVPFVVGYSPVETFEEVEPKTAINGWQFEDGVWRYYENGEARTGWFCSSGVDYYLLEDGAAATGWQKINGKKRFFSDTGAMRTGWLDDNGAVYYLLSNGEPATGQRTIDGEEHTFGTDGIRVDPAFLNK